MSQNRVYWAGEFSMNGDDYLNFPDGLRLTIRSAAAGRLRGGASGGALALEGAGFRELFII